MMFNLDPRVMAILAAVGTAALVAGAGALAQVLSNGDLNLQSSDIARILAAALSGAIAAYAQSARVPAAPPPTSGS